MPYVYSKVEDLDRSPLVGSHHRVTLVQYHAGAPLASQWREGESVMGNKSIEAGTAIATFVNKKNENNRHGNHAAFYLSKHAGGMWVIDQWKGDLKEPKASKRYIRSKGQMANGRYSSPSNNADALSIIDNGCGGAAANATTAMGKDSLWAQRVTGNTAADSWLDAKSNHNLLWYLLELSRDGLPCFARDV